MTMSKEIIGYFIIIVLLVYVLISYLEAESKKGFNGSKTLTAITKSSNGMYCELETPISLRDGDSVLIHADDIEVRSRDSADFFAINCKNQPKKNENEEESK